MIIRMTENDILLAWKLGDCIEAQGRPAPAEFVWYNDQVRAWQIETVRPRSHGWGGYWLPHVRCWENVGPLLALLDASLSARNVELRKVEEGWQAYCLSTSEQVGYTEKHPCIALTKVWLHLQRGQGRCREANISK
jgi:hypothetical protein